MAKVKDFFRRWLSGDRQAVSRRLTGPDPTPGYQNRRYDLDDIIINELPHWNYRVARMMLWDPVIILGLLTRNAAIAPAKIEVECKDARVREYIGRMWQTLWGKYSSVLLRTKHFGYAGFQADFCRNDETQTDDLESIKEFDPLDIRVRLHAGQPVGFRVISNQVLSEDQEPGQSAPILFGPRGVLLRYNAIAGKPSGNSILRGAYSPWYSKWMPGGAVKIKQLRMMKDAYLGDIFEYPYDRSVTDHNGNEIPWRDILREVAEARRTGAAMFLPSLYNTEGQKLVNYTPPQDTGDPKAIFEWVDQEDRDIWRGLGVFEEVIQASETGSGFSGRSVPMAMFLESCQEEVCDVVASVDTFLFQPLVWHNFGDIKYSVKPAQLLDIWGEKMGGTSMGGQAAGGGPQAPPPGQQGDEAEPKGPQPPQQPKSGKPPVQFAEPMAETEAAWLAPIVDYAQSDIIAARMAAAVQGAFRISAGELWAEMRRQVPADQRKGFTGAAAALLVGGAVAAILMRKRERAQEIVEDGLFAAAIVGAGAAQEQIDFIELPSTSKAETSAPASTAAVRTQPVTDPVTANPQNTGISEAFPPVPATSRQPVPATRLPAPQLESVVVTPSAPSVPAAPPIVTPQPEPLPAPAPPQPPQGKIPSTMDTFGRRRRLRFPTEEEARKKLRGATALAGQNYRETAQFVKQDAFAITTKMSDNMVAKIRDELESNMAKGMDLKSFVRRVEAIQRGEQFPLSRARIELVFRANTARYLSDAQDASLRHPFVADQFPYRAYAATHDDRVRDTHLRLEQTGLNGTNIYRATDPAWKAFRPPWAYNDRCSWRPVTVRQAARIGVVEANRWLGAAQAVAQVQGGLADQYLKGTAPQQPEFVPWPSIEGEPFYPSPEWSRDGVAQFADLQRGLFGDEFDEKPTAPKPKKKKFVNKDQGQGMLWTGLDLKPGQRDFLDEGGDDITEDTRAKKPTKTKDSGERWITIGGHPDGDKKHAGGTPVKIDGEGNIKAGPEALAKQGIKKLSDFGDKKDKKKPEKYDDSPKATGERIKEALKNAEGPMSLNELGKLIGVPAAKEDDPLSSPLNRAIVALRDSGDIETVESESGKGEVRFKAKGEEEPPNNEDSTDRSGDDREPMSFTSFVGNKKTNEPARHVGERFRHKGQMYEVTRSEKPYYVSEDDIEDQDAWGQYGSGKGFYAAFQAKPVEENDTERSEREAKEKQKQDAEAKSNAHRQQRKELLSSVSSETHEQSNRWFAGIEEPQWEEAWSKEDKFTSAKIYTAKLPDGGLAMKTTSSGHDDFRESYFVPHETLKSAGDIRADEMAAREAMDRWSDAKYNRSVSDGDRDAIKEAANTATKEFIKKHGVSPPFAGRVPYLDERDDEMRRESDASGISIASLKKAREQLSNEIKQYKTGLSDDKPDVIGTAQKIHDERVSEWANAEQSLRGKVADSEIAERKEHWLKWSNQSADEFAVEMLSEASNHEEKSAPKPIAAPKTTERKSQPQPKPATNIKTRQVNTAKGKRTAASFRPSKAFWKAREQGKIGKEVSVYKNKNGDWEGTVWGSDDKGVTKSMQSLIDSYDVVHFDEPTMDDDPQFSEDLTHYIDWDAEL